MRIHTRFCVQTVAVVALMACCAVARAQTPAASRPTLSKLIGERIEVTQEDNSVADGRLIRATDTSVVLEIGQHETEIARPRIREIRRWEKDSVFNGILIGALIGLGGSAVAASSIDTDEPMMAFLGPPCVLGGMGIGWMVDSLIKTKVLVAPVTASRVIVAPILTARRQGIAVTLSF